VMQPTSASNAESATARIARIMINESKSTRCAEQSASSAYLAPCIFSLLDPEQAQWEFSFIGSRIFVALGATVQQR
jgi:hypothetical protein